MIEVALATHDRRRDRAMALIDATVSVLITPRVGNRHPQRKSSFSDGLRNPHYTKPAGLATVA